MRRCSRHFTSHLIKYLLTCPGHVAGYGLAFCKDLNCSHRSGLEEVCDTTCMQQASLDNITSAWKKAGNNIPSIVFDNWDHWLDAFLGYTPTVDGEWIVETPMEALELGHFDPQVPLLFGTNNDEGATFIYAALKNVPLPTVLMEGAVLGIFGETDGNKVSVLAWGRG